MNLRIAKFLTSVAIVATLGAFITTPVFAWPTRNQVVNCTNIRWEMQNDTNKTYDFVGRVTEPITFEVKQSVKPGEWGVLDKSWNLSGKVKVKATISMGQDTRTVEKDLDCPLASPTPTPTPSPTPSPSPSPSPVPSPSATPCTNCGSQEQHQEQNNNQTVNVTVPAVLPATGFGGLALLSLLPTSALGFVLRKAKRTSSQTEENLTEFASDLVDRRNSS